LAISHADFNKKFWVPPEDFHYVGRYFASGQCKGIAVDLIEAPGALAQISRRLPLSRLHSR
jgi:hypothetical protein